MRVLCWAGRLWTGVLLAIVLLAGLLLGLRLALPLPFLSARPALLSATPPDGAVGVPPRARATLRFSVPMNPRSVERVLRIVPSAPVALQWNGDDTTLTISPTASLQPDATYRLVLDAGALSRMFRALERPAELSFRTAPAPAVVAVLPPEGAAEVAPTTPISIKFSRPIVPVDAVAQPAALPELHFDPPISGTVVWLGQAEVLFRPAGPLRPGTRYRASLDASLSDLDGGQLGSAFSWSFSTLAPRVLAVTPPNGAQSVGPRTPLVLTLSQPLDLAAVRASLVISPANAGEFSSAILPNATQQITYTPSADWRPDTTYTAALRAGVPPSQGTLPLLEPASWSFTAAPAPALTGRFPGEGQTLPSGQDLRLIFTTPMDEQSLRDAVRFTPPVGAFRVTTRDVEARISADVRPTTIYTVTLPASLTDRSGVPLGQEYRIRFQTASAAPELALPEAAQHVARLAPGPSVGLLVRRTNLSALSLDLYGLDEATIVRTLAFREDEWGSFQPERYAQPLLRSWSVQLADPLNTPVEDRLTLAADEQAPLPPGAYYLRIRTPDGPRADLLVLVSRTRLILQESSRGALIWATDTISGTPLGGLPVALYQDGGLLQRGATDSNGLWPIDRAGDASQPLIALTGGDRPGVASSGWSSAGAAAVPERYRAFLITDRAAYRPGERVALAGFVRRVAGQASSLPPPGLQAQLTLRQIGAANPLYRATLELGGSGLISDSFTLPATATDGEYILAVALGDDVSHTTFAIRSTDAQPLQVAVRAPEQSVAGDDLPLTVEATTPEGLPVAGAVLSWTLSAERVPYPTLDGYTLGDDELTSERPAIREGFGQTGADGRFSLVITGTDRSDLRLRYRLAARVTEPGGPSAMADGAFVVAPARTYAAVRLPSRIMTTGRPGAVELLAITPDGQPAPGATLRLDVYRRTWAPAEVAGPGEQPQSVLQPRDDRVFTRSVAADEQGAARVPLTLGFGGEYRVVASVVDQDGRRMSSAVSLWVAERGFTDWRAEPNGGASLITDRATYRPGDTATLLLASPFAEATALVARNNGGELAGEVRALRAGEPLTLTLRPEDVPAVEVSVLLVGRGEARQSAAGAPALFSFADTTIPVLAAGRALSVTITPDQAIYTPGTTATLTMTTTDDRGAGVPADVVVDVVGASAAPQRDLAETFRGDAPPALVTAQIPGAPAAPQPAPIPRQPSPVARAPERNPAPMAYWNPALRTNAEGVLTLTVQLPQSAVELRALAWAAAGADRFGVGQGSLVVTQPLALAIDAPPFVRAGDAPELAARVGNTSAVSQELSLALSTTGATPRGSEPLTRQLALAPGASGRVVWPVEVRGSARAGSSFTISATGALSQTIRADRPVLPSGTLVYSSGGALVGGRFSQGITVPERIRQGWGWIEIDVAPSSAALADRAVRSLATQPERSLLDEASLLLTSATLSDTRSLMQAPLDRLVAVQNGDGGWGWWPRSLSQPSITAAVLEALAAAGRAGLDLPGDVVERGAAAAQAALVDEATEPNLRAQLLYALSLHSRGDAAALRALTTAPRPPGPQGLAYALLADPGDLATLSRLEALAVQEGELAHWPADGADTLLGTDVGATSLALLALERARADGELVAGARRWLVAMRGSGSWSNAYEGARALAALRAGEPAAAGAAQQYTVTLNGANLVSGASGDPITATRSLSLTLDQLRERNELAIMGDGPLFLGYRIVSAATPPPADDGIGLLREYLDPLTGQPVDSAHLRAGQLLRVRLTAVATALQRLVVIEDALPAGVTLVEASDSARFDHVARAPDHLALSSAALAPGVYEYSYLVRAGAPGRYTAPALTARRADGRLLGLSRALVIDIAR